MSNEIKETSKPQDNFNIKIGGYNWRINFMSNGTLPYDNALGFTYSNKQEINITNALDMANTEIVIMHEVVHALLITQGRDFDNNFSQEDLCNFIAWNFKEIQRITKEIMEKRYC